jgi:DNA gyrase subunit A
MEAIKGDTTILTVTEKGYGKRTKLSDYRTQSRGGSGLINIKVTDKNGPVAGMALVADNDEIMITTNFGKIIRISMGDVSVIGRSTQGVKLMGVTEGEIITGIAPIAEKTGSEGDDGPDSDES